MRDLLGVKSIHFIGVGGVSMSKLCMFFHARGYICSGSDRAESDNLDILRSKGVNVYVGENSRVAEASDLVVYSAAIAKDNSELLSAKVSMERKELLAIMESLFNTSVCVAGAHGKTTVASMVAWLYKLAGIKAQAHIGGEAVGIDSFDIPQNADTVIIEACEYSRSFLQLSPKIGVILNIDYDHPDCYASVEDTYLAFANFANRISDTLVIERGYRDKILSLASESQDNSGLNVITFGGDSDSDYIATCARCEKGGYAFDVMKRGEFLGEFFINTLNKINITCALCVIAIGERVGISLDIIKRAIATFQGVRRRLEYLGIAKNGREFYTDYAHHPKELACLIDCVRDNFGDQAIIVFEPHTYSRTLALFDDFVKVLGECGELFVLPTYPAREKPEQGVDSQKLVDEISKINHKVRYIGSIDELIAILANISDKRTVFLVGAGIRYKEIYSELSD